MRREHLYLLRIWRDGRSGDPWRISLEEIRTKEVRHFVASDAFDRLVVFLQKRLAQEADQGQEGS